MLRKTLLAVLIAATAISAQAGGRYVLDPDSELRKKLNIVEFNIIGMLGFSEVGDKTAYTYLYKNEKDKSPQGYSAMITTGRDGRKLFLKHDAECTVGAEDFDAVIEVDGQAIQVVKICGLDSGKNTVYGYLPKTEAGLEFIVERFKLQKSVLVQFNVMKIPFSTEGFNEIWESTSEKPL